MGDGMTMVLARFASALRYDGIPERPRERCKDLLLDALACALVGDQGEETIQVRGAAAALGRSEESSVIGGGHLSLAGAALLNGYLITAVSMCDVHPPSDAHLTPAVVPAALVIAERDRASGRDFLVALAAGFETMARLGAGLDYKSFTDRGWNSSGVIGPMGAAAAAGNLMKFSPEQMASCFGVAGSQAAGTAAAKGTPTIKFHQCRSALSGLLAALLAKQGFGGPLDFFTLVKGGLYATYSGTAPKDAVTADLGARWELEQIALRLWPCPSATLGVVTALFTLMDEHDLKPDGIKRIRIGMASNAFASRGKSEGIASRLHAVNSAYYAVAVALHDGELWLNQFEPLRFNDPILQRFASDKVEIYCDDKLSGAQAVVEAEMDGGAIFKRSCETPKGALGNPLTHVEIENKFLKAARGRLSIEKARSVLDAVAHLEELPTVEHLMDLLVGQNPR